MRREEQKKRKKTKLRQFFKVLFITISVFFLVGVIGASALVIKYKPMVMEMSKDANDKVNSINAGTFKNKSETVIYDNKGNVIKKIAVHDYDYIENKDIKPQIKQAVISIEDARFYEHKGYDVKAIARAMVELIKNKGHITQGGSTITQQLVKVQFLSFNRDFSRKIEEILIATQLEKKYTKDQILEFYLNNINYGNGAYGIETASKTYFNKPSKDLTLSEIALLTGIPNNPTVYNPVRHMDNAVQRRDLILSEMKKNGYITQAQYTEAKNQKIVLNMPKKEYAPESYEVSYALSSATKILMGNQGFQFKYWFNSDAEREKYLEEYNDVFLQLNKKIRNGGYKIYTTIDMDKQAKLQASINKNLSGFTAKDKETGLYEMQGAGVSIDNRTGDLVAIVGGRTQDDVANSFNRAFLAYRQPGSSIKPLVVYTPAFERGMLDTTVMADTPIPNGPKNAGGGYHGNVTLRKAVEQSYNTIPFRLMDEFGAKNMVQYLAKLEFSNLVPEDANAIIALGGFTYGTTPLDIAGGYSTLAQNGEYIQPTGIQKIIDVTNSVIYENKHKRTRIYDSGSSYLMTDVLKGVISNGTAKGYGLSNMTSAGKTGTTNDNKDSWIAGYTPYFTTVIWTGYDEPQTMYNTSYSKAIWHDYMEEIHQGLKNKDFTMPDRISYMFINPYTSEVSKQDGHGWWRQQLVPEIYYELQEKRNEEAKLKAEQDREEAEKQRLEAIQEALKEAGVTQEEETQRENQADAKLSELENAHIYSSQDYEYVFSTMNDAKLAIEAVVLQTPQQNFYARYYKEVRRIQSEQYNVEHPKVETPVVTEPTTTQQVTNTPTSAGNTTSSTQKPMTNPIGNTTSPTTSGTKNGQGDTKSSPPVTDPTEPQNTNSGTQATNAPTSQTTTTAPTAPTASSSTGTKSNP